MPNLPYHLGALPDSWEVTFRDEKKHDTACMPEFQVGESLRLDGSFRHRQAVSVDVKVIKLFHVILNDLRAAPRRRFVPVDFLI